MLAFLKNQGYVETWRIDMMKLRALTINSLKALEATNKWAIL